MNLSPGAAQFLRAHVESALGLDVLLALYANPQRWWSGDELALALRVAPEPVARALDDLAIASLLDVKVGSDLLYRFAPVQDGIASLIGEIAALRMQDRAGAARRFIEPA
jgi:hypothetical protein